MSSHSDDEYDSEASDNALLPKRSQVAGWGSTARAALLFGLGFVTAGALISYGAHSNLATDTHFRHMSDDLNDFIQEAATHGCTNGYVPTHLDITNHECKLHANVQSQEDCEGKCDAETGCTAIEYNPHAKHCFTSTSGHDCVAKQIWPWVSCVKKGANITEDGNCTQDVEKEINETLNNKTNNETDNETNNETIAPAPTPAPTPRGTVR